MVNKIGWSLNLRFAIYGQNQWNIKAASVVDIYLHEGCVNYETVQCMLSQLQKYALSLLAKTFDRRLLRAKPSEIIYMS